MPAAAGDLTPGEISALSRAGYGRNDGDGRFWNDDDKKVVKAAAVTRDKGEVVRMVSLRSVTHFQPRSPRQRLGSALLLAFRDALQNLDTKLSPMATGARTKLQWMAIAQKSGQIRPEHPHVFVCGDSCASTHRAQRQWSVDGRRSRRESSITAVRARHTCVETCVLRVSAAKLNPHRQPPTAQTAG